VLAFLASSGVGCDREAPPPAPPVLLEQGQRASGTVPVPKLDDGTPPRTGEPLRVPEPPFAHRVVEAVEVRDDAPLPQLRKLREERNRIVDVEQWLDRVGRPPLLAVPVPGQMLRDVERNAEPVPAWVPTRMGGFETGQAIADGPRVLAFYGPPPDGGRILAVLEHDGALAHTLDFTEWTRAPGVSPDTPHVDQALRWAAVVDGVLYVSSSHRTYARSSAGRNAYVSALDPASGRLLWQSRPLVANATNFLVVGRGIITGYGFTDEPDFLYVLDRRDGEIVQTVPVRSGPEILVERDGRLHVRTYDRNYVFAIE
jgi:hypothetical protein